MPATKTVKDQLLEVIARLPDDSSYEQILREIAFERMIDRGLEDARQGRTISHEEMGRRIASWEK